MLYQKIKNPLSSVVTFSIFVFYFLVHLIGSGNRINLLDYFLYLIIFISGIEYTRKTLLLWFTDRNVALTLVALAFGTNLLYIVSLDYRLQTILLFSLYSIVLFYTAKWHEKQTGANTIMLAIGVGIIILLHPTGMFSLLIPVLWGLHDRVSWKQKRTIIRGNIKQVYLFIGCVAVLVLPPLLVWKISPGDIAVLSFKLPGVFISFSSWLWNDLLSFDHGWLIYTPIMLFALIGFHFIAGKFRPIFYPLFPLVIIELFMESSWSLLGKTPVFGQVAFVPFYAILAIALAATTDHVLSGKNTYRSVLFLIPFILVIFNLFQTYQYNNGIILPNKMSAQLWSLSFCRTHLSEWEKEIDPGYEAQASVVLQDTNAYKRKTLAFYDFEDTTVISPNALVKDTSISGKRSFRLNLNTQFSPGIKVQYSEMTKKSRIGIRITASVLTKKPITEGDLNFVVTSIHGGNYYHYRSLIIDSLVLHSGNWNTISFDYLSPRKVFRNDEFQSYIWYKGKDIVYIDNLRIDLFEPLN